MDYKAPWHATIIARTYTQNNKRKAIKKIIKRVFMKIYSKRTGSRNRLWSKIKNFTQTV